jgi:hypothetical protein
MKTLQKESLLAFLQGHKAANERIAAEHMANLAKLTEKESLRTYDSLCLMWQNTAHDQGLDERMIAFLIARRERINKVGLPKKMA